MKTTTLCPTWGADRRVCWASTSPRRTSGSNRPILVPWPGSATAEEVRDASCGVMPGTAGAMPEITVDRGWDEFDLAHVYTEMAPYLSAADADFRREYEEMQSAVTASQGAHDAPVHRRWI